jgi:hypothetical protein
LCGSFLPSWFRIRIANLDPDSGTHWIRIQSGSTTLVKRSVPVSDPDPQYCFSCVIQADFFHF